MGGTHVITPRKRNSNQLEDITSQHRHKTTIDTKQYTHQRLSALDGLGGVDEGGDVLIEEGLVVSNLQ